ncbi:MAG: hypothetical protein PUD93_07485 [Lachnospiraceae bacterium]|nr:hypothetical protein [Lachnospiraceae bacterium]
MFIQVLTWVIIAVIVCVIGYAIVNFTTLSLMSSMWIVCGIVWGLLILFVIGAIAFNRYRNREKKDK